SLRRKARRRFIVDQDKPMEARERRLSNKKEVKLSLLVSFVVAPIGARECPIKELLNIITAYANSDDKGKSNANNDDKGKGNTKEKTRTSALCQSILCSC